MAKKVQPEPVDILPAPSSSDDETDDQDGSSSDTDDEQHPPPSQKPQNQQPQNEEEESDGDDSDDETEDDEPEPVVKKPSLQQPQETPESDDDDESDDVSDETQSSPTASGFTIKPIVSKSPEPKTPTSKTARVKSRAKRPADSEETDKASKPVSKNQDKVKGGNAKRPAEVEVEKVSKSKKGKVSNWEAKVEKDSKSKKGDDESGEVEGKKSIIKWSEKDEVALLGGMIDYKAETGEDVNSKVDTFYDYAKDLISVSLTKNQLYEKIKRLKKKFQTNSDKWQNGEEPVFLKPHESKLFELSQKIWGSEGAVTEGNDSKVKTSKKKVKEGNVVSNASTPLKPDTSRELFVQEEIKDTIMEDKKEETKDFWSLYPRLCASLESEASGYLSLKIGDLKDYVKEVVSTIGEEKARELEDMWKDVHVMDHQLYAKRTFLISKQAEAMLERGING
ncbi:uncharacterized protein LOC141677595 isoform X1 [Apium graveolens]|uniref:uncharacterized protein LOC141677595 isoform X1 n=1 Tax=Apium graveolens TaxID=4045 RepID=UPI003D7A4790